MSSEIARPQRRQLRGQIPLNLKIKTLSPSRLGRSGGGRVGVGWGLKQAQEHREAGSSVVVGGEVHPKAQVAKGSDPAARHWIQQRDLRTELPTNPRAAGRPPGSGPVWGEPSPRSVPLGRALG